MIPVVHARKGVLAAALAASTLVGLSACEEDYGPRRYSPYEAGAPARVEEGTVVAVRPITFGGRDTGAGTAIGAVGGGLAGSAIAGRGSHFAGGIAGAVLGALAGTAIERSQQQPGFAYVVRFRRDGTEVEVPQPDRYAIPVGTRVVVSYGARVRVTPMGGYGPGYPPPPPPPAPPPRY